nr:hypothetical protein [Tanacetum cinerariifolium]
MLTAPKEPGSSEPKCAAKDIVDFYLNNAPKIFNQNGILLYPRIRIYVHRVMKKLKKVTNLWTSTENELMEPNYDGVNAWLGPKYDGKELRSIVREELGLETQLSDTLTNVVIPAYDIKRMRPVIFSSFKVSKDPTIN